MFTPDDLHVPLLDNFPGNKVLFCVVCRSFRNYRTVGSTRLYYMQYADKFEIFFLFIHAILELNRRLL